MKGFEYECLSDLELNFVNTSQFNMNIHNDFQMQMCADNYS